MTYFVMFFTLVSLIGFLALLGSMLAGTEKDTKQAGWLVYNAAIVLWGAHLLGWMP